MLFKVIPDIESIDKWQALNLPFEYNDFIHPLMLDNKAEIEKRVQLYNSLNRDRCYDTLHGPFYDITVHSADPEIRNISDKRIRQACDIAVSLKVKGVVLHTNLIPNFYNKQYRENWVNTNAEYFTTLLKDYKSLSIYMENMFDDEPDSLCKLANKINNNRFGICLDIGHCNISKTDIPTWINKCGNHIKQYHINDNDGKLDSHSTVGNGNIDWQSIISLMNSNSPALIEVLDYNSFVESKKFISTLIF